MSTAASSSESILDAAYRRSSAAGEVRVRRAARDIDIDATTLITAAASRRRGLTPSCLKHR